MRATRSLFTPLLCLLLLVPAVMVGGPPAESQAATPPNVLFLDLGTLGGTSSHGVDVHTSGLVVGASEIADVGTHAFSYDLLGAGPMRDLGALGSYMTVRGITDSGVVIGHSGSRAFAYDTTAASPTMTPLPVPASATTNPWMDVSVMDEAGHVAGWWGDDTDDGTSFHGYAYDPTTSTSTDLGGFGVDFNFRGVNSETLVGDVSVGDVDTGFVQAIDGSTARIELNTHFGWDWSFANDISSDGLVVGDYCDDSLDPTDVCVEDEWRGFAWDQESAPVSLLRREGGGHAAPRLVTDTWVIAAELFGQAVGYQRTALSQPPVLLEGLRHPRTISDSGLVVGQSANWTVPAVYDLSEASPQVIPLPSPGDSATANAAAHVGDHIVAVGNVNLGGSTFHAAAWIVGVPDAPTIGLATDTDGIAPVGTLTADETPTLAGATAPSGPVVVRASDGTVLDTVTADATTGAWSWTSPVLTDGTYQFTATLEPVGDWPSNPAAATVTVETVPPPVVTVGDVKVTGSTVAVPFTVDGSYEPATLTCQLDDTTPVPCANTTEHVFTELTQGDHVVTVSAATTAGRVGQGSALFTVKAAKFTEPAPPPTVLTVTITDVATTKNGPVIAIFDAQAGTAPYAFTCTLNGGTTTVTHPCASPWTYPTVDSWLAGGKYELTITVTDSAIPTGTATATTTVNVGGPKT